VQACFLLLRVALYGHLVNLSDYQLAWDRIYLADYNERTMISFPSDYQSNSQHIFFFKSVIILIRNINTFSVLIIV